MAWRSEHGVTSHNFEAIWTDNQKKKVEEQRRKEGEEKRLAPQALKFGPSGVGAPPSPNLNAPEKLL